MSNRSWFLISLSSGLIITALISRNGAVALLSVPILVYLFFGILLFPKQVNITADRKLEQTVIPGGNKIKMEIRLNNLGDSLEYLTINDPQPETAISTEQFSKPLISLARSEQTILTSNFQLKRGFYTWDQLKVIVHDPLGLFEKTIEFDATQQIIVRPPVQRLHPIPLRPASTLHSTGMVPARLAGSGTDFWGVRHYQSGDSLRHINWQKTARHPGHFFTRQFEQEEIMDIALILDTRVSSKLPSGADNLFEESINAAASLAEVFLRDGNRVGLLVFGRRMRHLFPGYGKHQLNSILRTLALVEPSPMLSLFNLKTMQKRIFQNRSQVIMISTPLSEDLNAYASLLAHGYPVLLICPDTVDYSFRVSNDGQPEALLAKRLAQIERRLLLTKLSRLGVKVVDWPLTQSLNQTLMTAIRRNGRTALRQELR